jgi:cleavage and polyadenylation specificity factor subunit 4
MQYNNYMPQQGVCRDFKDNKCRKQGCRFEHKYELCPDFDKGFCFKGLECPKYSNNSNRKHVIRKLCFDYLYGFCKDGPDCKMVHVKLFNKYERNDLKFTEQFYKLLKETGPYAYHIDPG